MSPTLSLRRRARSDDPPTGEQPDGDLPPIADAVHQSTSALAAKASTAGLLACLVLGPVGAAVGGLALVQGTGTTPTQSAPVMNQANDRAVVGEFAQRVVLTWLTSTQDSPDQLLGLVKSAQLSALSREAFTVKDPAVAGIAQSDGTWSVTVAATVTDARKNTARRFFQVPVRLNGSTVMALTLPAPVSPPQVASAPSSEYRSQLGAASASGQTVTQFLTAYLAGAGDVSRYLTPGVSMAALTPAPYTAVRLDDLRGDTEDLEAVTPKDGQRMRVLAYATASVTDKQTSSVAYALTLTARAGRWEITAIDPSPAFAHQAPDPAEGSAQPTISGTPTPSGTSSATTTP